MYTYEKTSLTAEIEKEIQSTWVKTMEKSTDELPETSDKIIEYLRDKESQHTSDYIIRRHLQNHYPQLLQVAEEKSGEKYVDLNVKKNIPWKSSFNNELAKVLNKEMPNEISKQQWFDYLSDHIRLQRKQLFKIALTLKMDVGTTQKFLIACGKEPYNLHSAWDILCLYCQQRKGKEKNIYEAVNRLEKQYENKIAAEQKTGSLKEKKQENESNNEPGITTTVNHLLNREMDDAAFLDELVKNSSRLTGYSQLMWSEYLRFARYLAVLYPEYVYSYGYLEYRKAGKQESKCIPETREIMKAMEFHDENVMIVRCDGYIAGEQKRVFPDLNKLLTAMFYEAIWFYGNKVHGKRDKALAKVQKDTGGLIQTFCNNYKERCMSIYKKKQSVDRQDVLLFSFFYISNYRYLSTAKKDSLEPEFKKIAMDDTRVDRALKEVRDILKNEQDCKEEPFETMTKCLNYMLNSFGFVEVYLPNPFDRFIVLALLSDAPMAVTSVILESIKSERKEGRIE